MAMFRIRVTPYKKRSKLRKVEANSPYEAILKCLPKHQQAIVCYTTYGYIAKDYADTVYHIPDVKVVS